jgi:hypothetical protein
MVADEVFFADLTPWAVDYCGLGSAILPTGRHQHEDEGHLIIKELCHISVAALDVCWP